MKKLLISLFVLAFAISFVGAQAQVEYPARDINDVVVWGAGGGTDLVN